MLFVTIVINLSMGLELSYVFVLLFIFIFDRCSAGISKQAEPTLQCHRYLQQSSQRVWKNCKSFVTYPSRYPISKSQSDDMQHPLVSGIK